MSVNKLKRMALDRGLGTYDENLGWLRGIVVNVIIGIGDQG